jgi:DNA replication protein DnaC
VFGTFGVGKTHVAQALGHFDDFAVRQMNASQADDLYKLVSERQGRSLIITGNRAPSDWYPLFPNPVVSESLLDRLIIASPPSHHERPQLSAQQTAQRTHQSD